ncbi:MAG TPA: hypothetical protein VF043_34810 [Ktedonobacteraceae bacterium]
MFNSICLQGRQTSDPNKSIDLGFLAEAMLFYKNVHLIADNVMLEQLISYCGVQLIWEIVNEGFLTINYLERGIGIGKSEPMKRLYFPMSFTSPSWKLQEVLSDTLQKISGRHGQNRKLSNRLAEHIYPVNISDTEIFKGIE